MKNLYQKEKGIYVYYVDYRGFTGAHFNTLYFQSTTQLFEKFMEWQICILFRDWDHVYEKVREDCSERHWYNYPVAYYAAYDQDGRWFSSTHLMGLYRRWKRDRYRHGDVRLMVSRNGHKKQAWGHFRYVRTTQEIRNYFVDPWADELGVKVDMRVRNYHTLPHTYEEPCSYTHKSWKKQSKRQHQYR